MEKLNLIVELKHSTKLEKSAQMMSMGEKSSLDAKSILKSNLFIMDQEFGTASMPELVKNETKSKESAMYEGGTSFSLDQDVTHNTYIVRGEINAKDLNAFEAEVKKDANVVGVYADVAIEPQLICPNSAPVGNATTVENLLCVSKMKEKSMDGNGVYVAIVDTGVNMNYLNLRGKTPAFNAAWSWKPATSTITPGNAPVGHGTMCAYDVCIAAPKCTILDIALLTTRATGPTVMSGFLSDAIKAYEHLIRFMSRVKRPGENASLVVNNSWGMFHPSWDFPVGHPGNFSRNPNHPFNLIVRRLSLLGADILFAAGNCGPECPDGRCQGVTNGGIYGANSSPFVTTVAGIGTNLDRVGYSNAGPGLLSNRKPDITGYTHFSGSGVYAADGGTSAACPVVAGVFAAIRNVRPYNSASAITSPTSVRNLVTSTARDIGASGWDYLYGFGVVNGCEIVKKLFPIITPIDICKRYPRICELMRRDRIKFVDLCKKNPDLCKGIVRERFIIPNELNTEFENVANQEEQFDSENFLDLLELSLGGEIIENKEVSDVETKKDCNCKH